MGFEEKKMADEANNTTIVVWALIALLVSYT